jgi:hypothetical protein
MDGLPEGATVLFMDVLIENEDFSQAGLSPTEYPYSGSDSPIGAELKNSFRAIYGGA